MVKDLTPQEVLFRSLVAELVHRKEPSAVGKQFGLAHFWNQAEFYYDVFCESVYMLMTDDSVWAISIDDCGYTRFDVFAEEYDCQPGFELLTKADMRANIDDLIVYVDMALSRLRNRLVRHGGFPPAMMSMEKRRDMETHL